MFRFNDLLRRESITSDNKEELLELINKRFEDYKAFATRFNKRLAIYFTNNTYFLTLI